MTPTGHDLEYQKSLLSIIKSLQTENRQLKTHTVQLGNELSQALRLLKRATVSKSNFLANMSHEIRTPMNTIIGLSEIELENTQNSPATLDAIGRIYNAGQLLLAVVADILDLSKLETGKLELLPKPYDTAGLINDVAQFNTLRMGDKPVDMIIDVREHIPAMLYGDDLRIKQILNNILSNAIKYTHSGSVTLRVESLESKDYTSLVFTIKDTGQGMTEDELKSLQGAGVLSHGDTNRSADGAGLGMSIVNHLVGMMGGTLRMRSVPGEGTTLMVYLPQYTLEGNSDTISREQIDDLAKLNFRSTAIRKNIKRSYMPYGRVLIVDDMQTNLFVAQGLMNPYGLSLETAISGFECIDKVKAGNTYDLIFMDHMMPEMDGMQTTQELRKLGYTAPIVALTANNIIGLAEEFLANGFDDFMPKPIDIEALNHVLNKYIRDKQTPQVLAAAREQQASLDNYVHSAPSLEIHDTDTTDVDDLLAALCMIDGLDVRTALDAMSGMVELYLDTVKLTLRLLPERVDKMDDFVNSNLSGFAIEVHGLKSALRNMGAMVLGNRADQLETAAKNADQAYCQEQYPDFRRELIQLEVHLNAATLSDDEANKETADISTLAPTLQTAKDAAESFDRDAALETLTPHSKYTYGEHVDTLLQDIVFALEAFDCLGAVEKLASLQESIS